jgi:hypothetical protein
VAIGFDTGSSIFSGIGARIGIGTGIGSTSRKSIEMKLV